MFGVLVQSCGELPLQATMKDAMEMFSWPVTIMLAQRSFHAIATCHRLWHCSNMAATKSRNWPVSKEQLQLLECFLVSLPEGKCLHACLIASSLTLMGNKGASFAIMSHCLGSLESLCKVVENCPCKQSTVKGAMEMFIKIEANLCQAEGPSIADLESKTHNPWILGHFNASSAWHREQELLARFSVYSVWPSYRWPILPTNIGLSMFQYLHCNKCLLQIHL